MTSLTQNLTFPSTPREGRIILTTFPNSGTSLTMRTVRQIVGNTCTEYGNEVKDATHGFTCGPGAFAHGDKGQVANLSWRSLVKSHGVGYGGGVFKNPNLGARRLVDHINMHYATTDGRWQVRGIIRLVRNPFDNLVARYHLTCRSNTTNCPSDNATISREAFLKHPNIANDLDIYSYLWWHHRANYLTKHWPVVTLPYELVYTFPEIYIQTVLNVLGVKGDVPLTKNFYIKPRDILISDGHLEPAYLEMFDEGTIRRISVVISRYLELSDQFRSSELVPQRVLFNISKTAITAADKKKAKDNGKAAAKAAHEAKKAARHKSAED